MHWVNRNSSYKRGLFLFTVFAMAWATLLLYAGAYTTSIEAGMAFLDWPLSNSSVNPDGWLTDRDMRAEHSHRLLGAKLGLLSIIMVGWIWLRESRRSVRLLSVALLAMVILQGLLGGLRVLYDQLNTGWDHNMVAQTFAVLHACGAQITVCMLATLAVMTSRAWIEREAGLSAPASRSVQIWGLIAVGSIFIQILIGAIMRHAGAGLAIPTFPFLPDGSLFPTYWSFPVTVHWLHRAGAVIVVAALLVFTGKLLGNRNTRAPFGWLVYLVLFLLTFQIFLGAATIWTQKNPVMASTHMLVGAFLLATTWMLTFLTFRLSRQPLTVNEPLRQVGNLTRPESLAKI